VGRLAGSALLATLLFAGAASAAAPKATLTVAVSGSGTVTSSPSGINCKPSCTLHGKKGEKVVLTATPNSGDEFSHWSAPCGTNFTCTVKMAGSRTIHAFFKKEATTPTPPAPPPPPTPQQGQYSGTYTDGTFIKFTVQGSSVGTFSFDNNGECDDGGTSYGSLNVNGPFTVQSDLTFTGTSNFAISNGNVSVTITGTLTTSGQANGTLNITLAFTGGPTCTSKGTWTAQDQG
jgi:hypothetical protein